MRALIVIILLILMPAWPCVAAETRAVQGDVNLSEVNWHQEATIPLTGEWELYWNQLLTPTEIEAGQGKLSAYLPPETEWHKTKHPAVDFNRWAGATYHLRVHTQEPQELMLTIPILNSASRIWINGELKQEFGHTSLVASEEVAFVRMSKLEFQAHKGENHITVQMSNHSFWYGGLSLPIRIGLPEAVRKDQLRATVQDAVSFGFILFMALYHLYIRLLLKRSNGALYFGVLSLGIALRLALVGDGQIAYQVWPSIPMQVRYFIEYMAVAAGTGYILCFYREMFPHESPRLVYKPAIFFSFAWSAFIIVAPPLYYPSVLEIFQLMILVSGIVTIVSVIVAARKGRDGARMLVMANLFFYVSVINDIVYHHRLMDTIPLVHLGLMFLMSAQALTLAQRFARTFDRAERAEHEVTKLNQSLEQKIVERTEQINTILSHVRSGFLLVDRDSRLQNGFTSSCQTILGQNLKVGEPLPKQLELPHHLLTQFMMAIQQIFDSDLPTEVAMQQLPRRFPVNHQMIGLQAAAVKSRSNGQVTAVLLTINDVTDLVAAEEGLRRADILIHILEDQDAFRIFLTDFKKDLEGAVEAIAKRDTNHLHSLLHTMKGNAASFNLDDWVSRLHLLEEKNPIEGKDIQNVTDHVRQFLRQNEGILHLDFDQPMRSVFGVDQTDLNALKESLTPLASALAMDRVEKWSRSVKALPLKSYTIPLAPMVTRVAEQLHKNACLVVEGADAKVDNAFAPLLTTLPHLIRNSLVHGIEDPEDRGLKPPKATITLRFATAGDGGLHIDIMDDGRGLDPEQIRQHAIARRLIRADDSLSDEQICGLIFHPNFSTAEKVTELAGRGMGLSAVTAAVQELGGRYEVQSQKNQGFHLAIIVPPQTRNWLDQQPRSNSNVVRRLAE